MSGFRVWNLYLFHSSSQNDEIAKFKDETRQLRTRLETAEAKIAEQEFIIKKQRQEIDKYKNKSKNQDEELKKMKESAAKARNQIDQVNKENMELKNKINELQKLLAKRYDGYDFIFPTFLI